MIAFEGLDWRFLLKLSDPELLVTEVERIFKNKFFFSFVLNFIKNKNFLDFLFVTFAVAASCHKFRLIRAYVNKISFFEAFELSSIKFRIF